MEYQEYYVGVGTPFYLELSAHCFKLNGIAHHVLLALLLTLNFTASLSLCAKFYKTILVLNIL